MAPQLGKRKRITRKDLERSSPSPSPSDGSDSGDMQELFRRAFEKKFKPLAVEPLTPNITEPVVEEGAELDEEESDWAGLSDDSDDDTSPKVQVIEYKDATLASDEETPKALKRAFMSSKPPTTSTPSAPQPTLKTKPADTTITTTTDAANLKNDLALQKLLRDSHILSAAPTPSLTTAGAARHKSTDLHMQTLGAKGSLFTQKKMPMAQRKHMADKARLTEQKRRHDAREGGIILEKEKREAAGAGQRKRERAVGGPSIGRFSGGTLTLSKKDVRSITGGPGSRGGRGGKDKGRGGRGGRGRGGKGG